MRKELHLVKAAIADQFPDLRIQTLESLGEGFRNEAALVNGEWVFRFPKSQQGADELLKEIRLLPLLADRLQVGIPQFQYVGRQSDGRPFVGYRKVPGEIVGEDGMSSLTDKGKDGLARRLADFMDALSAFPVETAIQAGVPVRNLQDEIVRLMESAKKEVFPLLQEPLQTYLSLRFQTYLQNPEYGSYTPALIHGDLSPDHYLMDPAMTELTGVIDFGDAAIGDPDCDYVYLLEDCGETFTRQVMAYRGQVDPDARIEKVSFLVTFDQVGYLLEGIRSGEKGWVSEGLDILEEDARMNRA
ncbi:phosphotransferase family protein [Paenibacillus flagellatus]|uniref:Aminoglycoside O-phosphotransferase APH(2'')-IIIa n=1 Tax=Paenibacillus flagellatus TaxID=2211139 RepID=A0A2V5KQ70_9BACL|nr:phosphotransferase [Paenibacillus flagellatus]PYI53407.1 aminoglycoside O-phosphotransferase APH(2'')-IIIa [Paenibacillus flagellatus]